MSSPKRAVKNGSKATAKAARRAALMQAEIAVGVKLALVLEHTDLVVADEHDPAIAVVHFGNFCDEFFRHLRSTLALRSLILVLWWAAGSWPPTCEHF